MGSSAGITSTPLFRCHYGRTRRSKHLPPAFLGGERNELAFELSASADRSVVAKAHTVRDSALRMIGGCLASSRASLRENRGELGRVPCALRADIAAAEEGL